MPSPEFRDGQMIEAFLLDTIPSWPCSQKRNLKNDVTSLCLLPCNKTSPKEKNDWLSKPVILCVLNMEAGVEN